MPLRGRPPYPIFHRLQERIRGMSKDLTIFVKKCAKLASGFFPPKAELKYFDCIKRYYVNHIKILCEYQTSLSP